ncbi:ATP synthase subunit I [Sulfitobacter guttiformis]|uniref:F1F0 ATPase subunit 2 n=2 Tax=Sulfitobacter guttiformis TaxID=74349 RepID=A0A420DJ52_9RHOB|nr:ATP synthase subunit I [Sulfitobacter guttiformis]RKE94276.1 F1F0 ATPase subunit 2 [Sulfitobacter guttiformis]
MDERAMIDLASLPLFITLTACFLSGWLIGYAYFRALRETTRLIVNEGKPLLALALTLGRISLLIAGFYIAVLVGALALLATLGGLLCAKTLMLHRTQRGTI